MAMKKFSDWTMNAAADNVHRSMGWSIAEFLDNVYPNLLYGLFGEKQVIPLNSTMTAIWRRFGILTTTPTSDFILTEGETPEAQDFTLTDITSTLDQIGGFIQITDVMQKTFEDKIPPQIMKENAKQAATVIERTLFETLIGADNVFYANSVAAKTSITTGPVLNDWRNIQLDLAAKNCPKVTDMLAPSVNIDTTPVGAAYIAVTHPFVVKDLRVYNTTTADTFVPVERYRSSGLTGEALRAEVGKLEDLRFLTTTINVVEAGAGGASATVKNTNGVADIYPTIIFGDGAYGQVALKGDESVEMLNSPPRASDSDNLAQRASYGWKTMFSAVRLYEDRMAVLYSGATI